METARPAGTTKKPWFKSGKNWAIIGGVIVVLGIIGSLMPKDETAPTGAPAATTQAPTSSAAKAAEKSTPAPTPTQDTAKKNQEWADAMEKRLLDSFGVKSRGEFAAKHPQNLAALANSYESPVKGTLVVTVQVTEKDTSSDEVKNAARVIYNHISFDKTDVDRVEVKTADDLIQEAYPGLFG